MTRNAEERGNSPEEIAARWKKGDQRLLTIHEMKLRAGAAPHSRPHADLPPAWRELAGEIPPPIIILQDALRQLIDYVKDGCPDDCRYLCLSEAEEALVATSALSPPACGGTDAS